MKITEVGFRLLEIENDGYHLLVEGKINGKPANFLIDTGASRTVFDQVSIHTFIDDPELNQNERLSTGIGTNTMASMVTTIQSLAFGDLNIKEYTAIVIDLQHVHTSYNSLKLPEINGILGGDILAEHKAVINYKSKKIKFYY
ncbi:MAG: clan AA aspartic protease [Bacteroidales bacterium]|nr:clan AA aspartic protease [Bacteroidales bacterium]